jgi:hypothetical protein
VGLLAIMFGGCGKRVRNRIISQFVRLGSILSKAVGRMFRSPFLLVGHVGFTYEGLGNERQCSSASHLHFRAVYERVRFSLEVSLPRARSTISLLNNQRIQSLDAVDSGRNLVRPDLAVCTFGEYCWKYCQEF